MLARIASIGPEALSREQSPKQKGRNTTASPGPDTGKVTYQIAVLEPQELLGAHVLVHRLVVGYDAFAVGARLGVGVSF